MKVKKEVTSSSHKKAVVPDSYLSFRKYEQKRKMRLFLIYMVLIVACLIAVFPLFWMIGTSLKSRVEAFSTPPIWFFSPKLDSYKTLFFKKNMTLFLLNSIIISISSTFISVVIGTIGAYSLTRFEVKGSQNVAFWILSNRLMAPIARVLPIFYIGQALGLLDTRISLIILYSAMQLPFVIWMMRGFLEEIPRDIEEAAMVDGDSWFGAARKVTLPMAMPAITATAIFVLILSWNEFAFAFVLAGGRAKTLPPSVLTFMEEGTVLWHEVGAAASIISIPIILFALLVQKNLVRGLTFGMLKD